MKKTQFFLILGCLIFSAALIFASLQGNFWQETDIITGLAWGKLMLVDLYFGFAAFSVLIFMFESSIYKSLIWIVLLFVIGNLVSLVYLLMRMKRLLSLLNKEN